MNKETQRKLFLQLILQNQQMALISMGKTASPVSNKIEKNLNYARVSIDILDMLYLKTKGNLSKVEDQYLSEMISRLKIDFADASNEPGSPVNLEEQKSQTDG